MIKEHANNTHKLEIIENDTHIKETNQKLSEIVDDIKVINDCFNILNELVDKQQYILNDISYNIEKTNINLDKGNSDLNQAQKLATKSAGLTSIITFTTAGIIIGGPIGGIIGLNSIIGVSGGIIGGGLLGGGLGITSSSLIQKNIKKLFISNLIK